MPYALVPTPDEYGLGGFERRLPRDAFACVDIIEIQASSRHLGKSSLLIRNCEAIASLELVAKSLLKAIRSYEMADQVHPNEFGYLEMAKQACEILNKILAASFWAKTDEAQAGARYTAGLAVVAVGGLFAVFATISRKGRRGLDAGAKGYGATDSSVDALLA